MLYPFSGLTIWLLIVFLVEKASKINIDTSVIKNNGIIIQQRCLGVVIPCFNEEKRLESKNCLTIYKNVKKLEKC